MKDKLRFSIWFNEKDDFFELLQTPKRFSKIHSVYFPLPKFLWSSGRPAREQKNYIKQIFRLLYLCQKIGIIPILLLNATFYGPKEFSQDYLAKLFKFIDLLLDKWLKAVSIVNPIYIKLFKERYKDKLIIYNSVNCRIKEVEQAIYFKNLGVEVITIDRDINRKLDIIKSIKERVKLPLQIMLNEPCIRNCPFRQLHFDLVAHNIEQIFWKEFEEIACYEMFRKNRRLIFRIPFIRPEDLKYYINLVDIFKLVTRDAPTWKIKLMLDAYSKMEYHGNLIDLFDLEPTQWLAQQYIDNDKLTKLDFFERIKNCPGDCDNCKACDIYF